MARQVLVVEDNQDLARLVAMHLGDLGCEVETCADGESALDRARGASFDLIILDVMLPGLDGLELCRRLRAGPHYVPILMLTAKSSELDRVLGLEVGADDYLTKPFSVRELLARIKALFRRVDAMTQPPPEQAAPVRVNGLEIHPEKRRVRLEGEDVELTAKEFDLLLHFASHPGRVYTRGQLLERVWGYGHAGYEHTVNSHINRLRSKIERTPARPRYILTVWGVGYKFAEHPRDV